MSSGRIGRNRFFQRRFGRSVSLLLACVLQCSFFAESVTMNGYAQAAVQRDSIHTNHAYPDRTTPHPQAGTFTLKHEADRPLIAFYGGIGLHDLGNGRLTSYNIGNRAAVDLLIEKCRRYGVNKLYVPIYEEWTPTELLVQPPEGAPHLIPYFIEQAHKNNIAVYATIAVFAVSEKDRPFLEANPHTLTRSESGEQTPHMFSPAYPEVRAYKRAVLLEWLSMYPIDGIQLDYIRWPFFGGDLVNGYCAHGYDATLLEAFRTRYREPDDFRPAPDDPRFVRLRTEYVTLFIKELRDALKRSDVDLPIGVYNSNAYGYPYCIHDVCQDWIVWEEQKLVDEHHPMFLMDSITRLARATQSLMEIRRNSVVYGPIFLAEGFEPAQGFVPTAEMCLDAARRLIKQGCNGLWFCRGAEVQQFDLWEALHTISRFSLSEIRKEKFDPLYENLVVNGDFERGLLGWSHAPAAADRMTVVRDDGVSSLQIDLSADAGRVIEQSHRFSTHPVMAVRSLGFSFVYAAGVKHSDTPPTVSLRLAFSNGDTNTMSFKLSNQPRWNTETNIFQIERNSQRVLKSAAVCIDLPVGEGTVEFREFELLYDPIPYNEANR